MIEIQKEKIEILCDKMLKDDWSDRDLSEKYSDISLLELYFEKMLKAYLKRVGYGPVFSMISAYIAAEHEEHIKEKIKLIREIDELKEKS